MHILLNLPCPIQRMQISGTLPSPIRRVLDFYNDRASGNLKLAQELARHKNIQVTQRYAHLSDDELDKGYYEIFENRESKE